MGLDFGSRWTDNEDMTTNTNPEGKMSEKTDLRPAPARYGRRPQGTCRYCDEIIWGDDADRHNTAECVVPEEPIR